MPKEKFYEYIEEEIKVLLGELKPEFLEKAVFTSTRDGNREVAGIASKLTNPPTITFCVNSLEETIRPEIVKELKRLITHELIHCIQKDITLDTLTTSEKEAYFKDKLLKFFRD